MLLKRFCSLRPLELRRDGLCPLYDNIASMRRCHRFDQHDPAFRFRNGIMHFSLRHNMEIAFVEHDLRILILNLQTAFANVEKLVLMIMLVPRQHPFGFGDLDILIIDLPDDLRRPVVRHVVEFAEKIHGVR